MMKKEKGKQTSKKESENVKENQTNKKNQKKQTKKDSQPKEKNKKENKQVYLSKKERNNLNNAIRGLSPPNIAEVYYNINLDN